MRSALRSLIYALLVVVCLSALAFSGVYLYQKSYVNINGVTYSRDLETLDLSGQSPGDLRKLPRFHSLRQADLRQTQASLEDILWLREQLPQCEILWELPFQGQYYPLDTQHIAVKELSFRDVELLDHLPALSSVDAWDCRDYGPLLELQQRRPECKVFYNVLIDGVAFDCDTLELTLHSCADPELERKLRCLPKLRSLHLTGSLPSATHLRGLVGAFPQIAISWKGIAEGMYVDSARKELDLSHSGMTLTELDRRLTYFPGLETLYLGKTDLPAEALLALEKGHGRVLLVWDLVVEGVRVRRDIQELDLSGRPVENLPALEERLALFPRLEKVIMCGCGIPSPEMDQLDRRHDDIRFVWSVDLGGIPVRTDATYFAPNKYYIEVDDAAIEELKYCRDMVCVDIGHNRGVTHCQWATNMPELTYLVLADTNIKDLSPLSGLKKLKFLEVFTAPVRDYRPLLGCTALEDLNLGYTYGDPTPVMEMTWLKMLWWPGSLRVLNWSVRNQLRTNLPNAKMNFVAGSSTGEGWRASPNYYAMRDLIGMPYMTG